MKRLAIVAVLLVGCTQAAPAPAVSVPPRATALSAPSAPTTAKGFDLALVKANFTDECRDPIIVDDLFCQQVRIDGMSADGTILVVPTTLNAASTSRAAAICGQVALAHFDGATGNDLGYQVVGILDKDGGNAAACPTN